MTLLAVRDLRIYYKSILGDYKVVDGVSFKVDENEIFGIAGESGCGKSTLVEGILRLIRPPGYIKSGEIIFKGRNILQLDEESLRKIRWKEISYIPQGSMSSLNPVMRIEDQIIDAILTHTNISKKEAKEMVPELLKKVGLPPDCGNLYPCELSGGMKQRVIIAMAVALMPSLVIADEPTTALDLVIQKVILQSLINLNKEYKIAIVLVSHDMAVHAQTTNRMAIMYAGKIVEIGSTEEIFYDPLHPYTRGLVNAIPSLEKKKLKYIPGISPSPLNWPPGCRFHPRCPYAIEICRNEEPKLKEIEPGRFVACHQWGD